MENVGGIGCNLSRMYRAFVCQEQGVSHRADVGECGSARILVRTISRLHPYIEIHLRRIHFPDGTDSHRNAHGSFYLPPLRQTSTLLHASGKVK